MTLPVSLLLKKFDFEDFIIVSNSKFSNIRIIDANILIISSLEDFENYFNARVVSIFFRVYIYFSYVKLRSVFRSAVRKHSVFVQPFVKLPRRLLSYFDISVHLVHVRIQTSSPAISRLLSSGQLRNLGKGPYRMQSSRNF